MACLSIRTGCKWTGSGHATADDSDLCRETLHVSQPVDGAFVFHRLWRFLLFTGSDREYGTRHGDYSQPWETMPRVQCSTRKAGTSIVAMGRDLPGNCQISPRVQTPQGNLKEVLAQPRSHVSKSLLGSRKVAVV